MLGGWRRDDLLVDRVGFGGHLPVPSYQRCMGPENDVLPSVHRFPKVLVRPVWLKCRDGYNHPNDAHIHGLAVEIEKESEGATLGDIPDWVFVSFLFPLFHLLYYDNGGRLSPVFGFMLYILCVSSS